MALKSKYAKKEDIPKGAEEHYTEREGEWHLDSDHEDVGALKRAKDHEARDRKKAEDRVKALETELSAKETEIEDIRKGAIPKADVEALEKSIKGKYEKTISERDATIAGLSGQVDEHLKDATVARIASELFDKHSALGAPHIAARLSVVDENGKRVLKVLKDGQPSAMTTDDLKKEFLQDKSFAGILVGSRASGGGANGGGGGSGAPAGGPVLDAAKASPKELVAHLQAKKDAGASR